MLDSIRSKNLSSSLGYIVCSRIELSYQKVSGNPIKATHCFKRLNDDYEGSICYPLPMSIRGFRLSCFVLIYVHPLWSTTFLNFLDFSDMLLYIQTDHGPSFALS